MEQPVEQMANNQAPDRAQRRAIAEIKREQKANLARSPIMMVVSSFLALAATCLMISISLDGKSHALALKVQQTQVEIAALQNSTMQEDMIRDRLKFLTASSLTFRYHENHSGCLARGIQHANGYFGSLDYTSYPDVRNSTIRWVKEQCDVLHFTPQIRPKTGLELLKENAQMLFEFLVHRLGSMARIKKLKDVPKPPMPTSNHVYLPRGYRLIDCDPSPCTLFYTAPVKTATKKRSPLEALQTAQDRLEAQQSTLEAIYHFSAAIEHLTRLSKFLGHLFLIFLLYIEFRYPRAWKEEELTKRLDLMSFSPREQVLASVNTVEILLRAVAKFLQYSDYHLNLQVSSLVVLAGAVSLLGFLLPVDTEPVPNICTLAEGIRQLLDIYVLRVYNIEPPHESVVETHVGKFGVTTAPNEKVKSHLEKYAGRLRAAQVERVTSASEKLNTLIGADSPDASSTSSTDAQDPGSPSPVPVTVDTQEARFEDLDLYSDSDSSSSSSGSLWSIVSDE